MEKITFQSYIDLLSNLKIHYLTVPSEIVEKLGGIGSRLKCSVNGGEYYQCGMVALGGGAAYISFNKKRMKECRVEKGDLVEVSILPDDSKYGFDLPEELEALFEQDEEGFKKFEKLADGHKRYIIYYVTQVKSSQKRIDRSILLINNLKTMPEKFSFRHLLGMPPRNE